MTTMAETREFPFSAEQFRRISERIYAFAGIRLPEGKQEMVYARLARRLRALGIASFDDYLRFLELEPAEWEHCTNALTTNVTSFYREEHHFRILAEHARATARPGAPFRVWSAGCSSGEEPYTLAMVVRDVWPGSERRDVKILATDISRRVLAQARAGVYSAAVMEGVPEPLRRRHFVRVAGGESAWQVSPAIRRLVSFASLNLMGAWPMRGPFDAIFCRNVMIYFDKPTQQGLVERYYDLLAPGGHLFVGHSESLSGLRHRFRYVQPALYCK